jgi:hypothetical protein
MQQLNQKAQPCIIDSSNLTRDTPVKVTLVTRPMLIPAAQKLCSCEHVVFINRTYVYF